MKDDNEKKQSRLGKGRAFLIFRDTPIIDFTREITDLCLKNYAYDPQCEGDRSEYAMQFLRELPNKQRQKVIEAVRTHLANLLRVCIIMLYLFALTVPMI